MDRLLDRSPLGRQGVSWKAILSYIFDYAIIVALAILYAILDKIVTPFHQHFALQNYTLQYPYAVHERIPIHVALLISGVFPVIVIAVYTLIVDGLFSHHKIRGYLHTYTFKDRLWELNCGILGLLLSQGAAFVVTGSLKNLCGKPRPDFIDRCQPLAGSVDPPVYGLSNASICTRPLDGSIMLDAFRSFPSGHSSSSFAGLFYLSLYLAGKLHVLDNRGEVWRTLIVLIPTLAAACVAMSRIMDARHHPFDVLFGSTLGILVAWGSYRQYFPAVSDTARKGRAWPMRTWGQSSPRPGLSPDDVQQSTRLHDTEIDGEENSFVLHSMRRLENPDDSRPTSQDHDGARSSTGAADPSTRNVFRDRVARSQRERRMYGVRDPSMASSDEDEYVHPGAVPRTQAPQYTLTNPDGQQGRPISAHFGDETGYGSQDQRQEQQ